MREIMPRIKPEWVDEILIVDGGSTDGTIEYAKEQGYATYVQKRKGIRHAYIEGLPLVKTDCVITFSPDGNSVPEAIPDLIEKIKGGYDMVIASRYLGDAVSHDDGVVTRLGNWLFTTFINILHKGTYTDAMVIFRIYKKSLFYDLKMDTEESYNMERWFFTTMGIEPLLSVRCAKYRKRYAEIAEDEPKRIGGERKLQIFRWGAAYFMQIIKERFISISVR
ncbi:MAG: glycosyltransferase family 2 protein [Bacteroidetes Order II. Incertae sedis bacterium]|jgi:glycosyltransferase involved in cell wall biosynthesis|nr:glycosyltransferase family 2 protein [Bacteroidetes Order II. bacterium]